MACRYFATGTNHGFEDLHNNVIKTVEKCFTDAADILFAVRGF